MKRVKTMRQSDLSWDSAFFGKRVARLEIEAEDTEPLLERALLRSAYDCCYIFVAEELAPRYRAMLAARGAILYDRKTVFEKTDLSGVRRNDGIDIQVIDAMSPDCLHLAVSSGEYSRFSRDPHFRSRQPALYERWLRNCLADPAGRVWGGFADGRQVAMVCAAVSGEDGQLGLIAVDENYRQRGIARALLGETEAFYQSRGATRAVITTQWDNRAACHLYTSMNYRIQSVTEVWHLWKI